MGDKTTKSLKVLIMGTSLHVKCSTLSWFCVRANMSFYVDLVSKCLVTEMIYTMWDDKRKGNIKLSTYIKWLNLSDE